VTLQLAGTDLDELTGAKLTGAAPLRRTTIASAEITRFAATPNQCDQGPVLGFFNISGKKVG
jgi:hypothetical protein